MQNPAVTLFTRQDGTVVLTAGPDIPVEDQVHALHEAGRLNQSPVPDAIRGEVWTRGQVRAQTFFEPVSAPAAATPPAQETAPGADETHNLDEAGSTPAPATDPQPAAETAETAETTETTATSPPPISGKRKSS